MDIKIGKRKWFWAIFIVMCLFITYEGTVRYLARRGKRLEAKSQSGDILNGEDRILVAKKALNYAKYAYRLQPWNREVASLVARIYGGISYSITMMELEDYYDVALLYAIKGFNMDSELREADKPFSHSVINAYFFTMARIYYLKGNFDGEVNIYQNAIRKDPDLPLAYYKLGKLHLMNEQLKDSRWYFIKAVSLLCPDKALHWRINRDLAYLDYVENDIKVASSRIEKVLQNLPTDAMALFINGLILKSQKQYDEAEHHFLKSIENKGREKERWHQYIDFNPEKHLEKIKGVDD